MHGVTLETASAVAKVLYWVMWAHSALRLTRLSCGVLRSPAARPPETLTVTVQKPERGGGGAGVVLAPCSIQSLPMSGVSSPHFALNSVAL